MNYSNHPSKKKKPPLRNKNNARSISEYKVERSDAISFFNSPAPINTSTADKQQHNLPCKSA